MPLMAAPAFTIDQVLSAPFPDNLIASPQGDAVAWVLDAAGVRNIWVARAPGYQAAPVTKFSADDGQEIAEIAWTPDGSALAFTRGGGANGRGEFPNPRSDPAGVRQEIWMAAVSGEPVKLGDGHSPAISPDGSTIVWVTGGQVWAMGLTGSERKAAQLIHARGAARDL